MTAPLFILLLAALACLCCWLLETISARYPIVYRGGRTTDTMPAWANALRWALLLALVGLALLIVSLMGTWGVMLCFAWLGLRAVAVRRWSIVTFGLWVTACGVVWAVLR